MGDPDVPLRRYLVSGGLVAIPAAAAIALLAYTGEVGTADIVLAGVAAFLIALLIVRPYLRGLARFARFVDTLAGDGKAPVARFEATAALADLAGAAATLTDDWRRNREAMENLAASAQAIVDGLPDPLITLDRRRRVVRANRAAVALLGATPLGRDLAAWLRQPALLDAVDAVLSNGAGKDHGTAEIVLAGPPDLDLVAHVQRLPRAAADGSLALVALHDVSAQRRAERMRADFVANASHELKTPLAALLGFIETLRGPARDDHAAQERFLGIMAEQTERMRRLVNDLLALSQIEQREHTRPDGQVHVGPVLRSVADALQLRAADRNVRIVLDIPPDLPAVAGDRDEITTVFQNLVDNAVKFTRTGTSVRVWAQDASSAGMVRVSVIDHGEGITPEHLPRLTERFYRVDTARSRDLGGTGLGLAIVKHLVNRHRGRLSITSDPGSGAVFAVQLPHYDAGP
jgi:two-component system phosphate regulon sensor histidine kinase PhoR